MRTQITVTELNDRQWDHLTNEVPVNGPEILAGAPVLCVVFTKEGVDLHVEMDLVEFTTLLAHLENIKNETVVTTKDTLAGELNKLRDQADLLRCAERAKPPADTSWIGTTEVSRP